MVFSRKLTLFLHGLLQIDSQRLDKAYAMLKKEVLSVLLEVKDILAESCPLATLRIHQDEAALCHPLDEINPSYSKLL